ncbi:TolC family protein [Ralstonia sp. 1B3]
MAVHANAAPPVPSPRGAQTATARADEVLPQPRYTLQQLLELARANHPALAASQAQVQAAQAGITTARAWPNPEVEAMAGRQRARMPGAAEGRTNSVSITQKLDCRGSAPPVRRQPMPRTKRRRRPPGRRHAMWKPTSSCAFTTWCAARPSSATRAKT